MSYQKAITTTLFVVFTFLWSQQGLCAIFPGTAGSILSKPEAGIFMTPLGFQLVQSDNTRWKIQSYLPEEKKVSWQKSNSSATASLVSEEIKTELTIEKYARRWTKNFFAYGFDVLGIQDYTINNQKVAIVDLIHRQEPKQVRQVLFLKDKKLAILSCSGDKDKFVEVLQDCNSLAQGFYWQ